MRNTNPDPETEPRAYLIMRAMAQAAKHPTEWHEWSLRNYDVDPKGGRNYADMRIHSSVLLKHFIDQTKDKEPEATAQICNPTTVSLVRRSQKKHIATLFGDSGS